MALPKLNATPKYELTLPSSGQPVKFRPFVVKEEKALMIAMESGKFENILHTLNDVIDSCVDLPVKSNSLPSFDVEYMFIQIRSKSVGETTTIGLKCDKCEHTNEVSVNLEEIQVTIPEVDKNPEIQPGIQLELDWPSFSDIVATVNNDKSQAEVSLDIIKRCIKAVKTEEERISMTDVTDKEVTDFLESMDSKQFDMLKTFIEKFPKVEHTFEYDCSSCGEHNQTKVEGATNFLS